MEMVDPLTAAAGAKVLAGAAASEAGKAAGAAVATKASEGAIQKARELAARFRNREVAFIEDPETIRLVTDARKHPEYLRCERSLSDANVPHLRRRSIARQRVPKVPCATVARHLAVPEEQAPNIVRAPASIAVRDIVTSLRAVNHGCSPHGSTSRWRIRYTSPSSCPRGRSPPRGPSS